MFNNIGLYFNLLKKIGPGRGYYPETSKIFLIMHPHNISVGKEFVLLPSFNVFTGTLYLGSFIRDDESRRAWPKDITPKWEEKNCVITKKGGKYPQENYAEVFFATRTE